MQSFCLQVAKEALWAIASPIATSSSERTTKSLSKFPGLRVPLSSSSLSADSERSE